MAGVLTIKQLLFLVLLPHQPQHGFSMMRLRSQEDLELFVSSGALQILTPGLSQLHLSHFFFSLT